MYRVSKLSDSLWNCQVQIQDGTERWTEKTREEAVFSVIKAARTLNSTYIKESDIEIINEVPTIGQLALESMRLLDSIKRGEKVLLDCRDRRVDMKITEQELDLLVAIREGEARVVW